MTYAEHRAWDAYQPYLPPALRCEGDAEPLERYWDWRGHRIHLDRHVDPAAPVKLIALHGGGGNGRLIASVGIAARGLAETVAPDLPGYGHTHVVDGDRYTYADWVDCVEALVEAESSDGRPIVLFGASMGGMLGFDVAARSPRVRAVVATCLLDPRDREVRRAVVRHPALASAIPVILALEPLVGGLRVPVRLLADVRAIANDPGLVEACLADPVGGGNRVPLSFIASWLRSERPSPPQDVGVPVLLAHPGADRWTPPHLSRAFLDRVGGDSRYVELPNCGHFPVEEPGISTLAAAMSAFIRQVLGDDLTTRSPRHPERLLRNLHEGTAP